MKKLLMTAAMLISFSATAYAETPLRINAYHKAYGDIDPTRYNLVFSLADQQFEDVASTATNAYWIDSVEDIPNSRFTSHEDALNYFYLGTAGGLVNTVNTYFGASLYEVGDLIDVKEIQEKRISEGDDAVMDALDTASLEFSSADAAMASDIAGKQDYSAFLTEIDTEASTMASGQVLRHMGSGDFEPMDVTAFGVYQLSLPDAEALGNEISYNDLDDKPTLFDGAYSSLTGVPSTFTPSSHTHTIANVTGLQGALDAKFAIPSGTTGQYVRGDGTLASFPSIPASQVNADWNSVSGVSQILNKPSTFTPSAHTHAASDITSGTKTSAFISDFVEAAQDAVGGALSAFFVYDDTANTITLRAMSFATPSRAIVTTTASTGYQISSSRVADVCYEGTFQTTSTIGGPSSVSVFLETADTNSTTPGDWTTVAQQTNSNTITLAAILQQVDIEPWSICRKIPAGKYVRIRSGSVTGTATATINSTQQEVLF